MDNEQLRDLVRQGVVTEVIGSKARVTFPDRDDVVSAPLAVLQLYTGSNKSIRMPSINEEVVCLFLPTGQEDGYIIGSVYTEGNNPPAENNAIEFEDGSSVSYAAGVLNIMMTSAVNITAPTVTINGNTQANGRLSATGVISSDSDVMAGTVSLKNHTNGGKGVDG